MMDINTNGQRNTLHREIDERLATLKTELITDNKTFIANGNTASYLLKLGS